MADNRKDLRDLGFEEEDINDGNVGFEIEDQDTYFLRELMENRREQGLEVPEEWQPTQKSRKELDMYRRQKDHERLNLERSEDKSQQWSWTEKDEQAWKEDCLDKGYFLLEDMDECYITGNDITDAVDACNDSLNEDNQQNSAVPSEVELITVKQKGEVITMVDKTKATPETKAPAKQADGQQATQVKMELLDFQGNKAVTLKGEFKMTKFWSSTKGKWMFRLEGEHNVILIGGAGENGKNVWAGVTEAKQRSTGPTMTEITA